MKRKNGKNNILLAKAVLRHHSLENRIRIGSKEQLSAAAKVLEKADFDNNLNELCYGFNSSSFKALNKKADINLTMEELVAYRTLLNESQKSKYHGDYYDADRGISVSWKPKTYSRQ